MSYDLTPAVYAALGAFALNIILCPIIIPLLTKLKFGTVERSQYYTAEHLKKNGTPTMGGIMIILSFAVISLFFIGPHLDNVVLVLVTLAFAVLGFVDDYLKIAKHSSDGLKAWQKMLGQLVITTLFVLYLIKVRQSPYQTSVYVPFMGRQTIDLGALYIPFIYLVMLGTVNGANFTDGLDGLASGVTALIVAFFLFAAWALHSTVMPLAGAAAGALLGFLLFNSYPAKVFMGDTGSLALGGFVATIAILLKMPLFIAIVALIYLIEVLSVILQVAFFKLTGKRIFPMTPIHHSFEKSGWTETKIVALFYIVTAILCLVGYLGGKAIA
jgi:phospho-N-acetylmuramoyl-pentapeptide-transferase